MANLMGVDVGTQSVRATLVNEKGELLAQEGTEYPLSMPQPGWTEQSPSAMMKAAHESIRKVASKHRVDAISQTGQMHTMILIDGKLKPIGRALLWNDGRAAEVADECSKKLGSKLLKGTLCNPFLANWTGAHLAYVSQPKPAGPEKRWEELWAKAYSFVTPRDLLVLSLTGVHAMDYCGASETSLMDVKAKAWSTEVFQKLGIDKLALPPLYEPGAVIGTVTKAAAKATGLREDTPVVAGAGDCLAGALAGGVTDVGQLLFTLGTSGVAVAPVGKSPLVDDDLRTQIHYSTEPDNLVNMVCVNGAGIGLRLYRDVLGHSYVREAKKRKLDPYEVLAGRAAQAPPGSNGLMFSPYISGDRLVKAPRGKGAWYGLSDYLMEAKSKGDANLIRSVMEGVCLAVKDGIEVISALLATKRKKVTEIRMVGGGSRSPFWVQLAANVFGQAVHVTSAPEGSQAMALLAGVGINCFRDVREAAKLIKKGKKYSPKAKVAKYYDALYHQVYAGHYDRSQRALDEAMEALNQKFDPASL